MIPTQLPLDYCCYCYWHTAVISCSMSNKTMIPTQLPLDYCCYCYWHTTVISCSMSNKTMIPTQLPLDYCCYCYWHTAVISCSMSNKTMIPTQLPLDYCCWHTAVISCVKKKKHWHKSIAFSYTNHAWLINSFMSRLTSSFTCQLISVIITAQNLPFQQILPTLILLLPLDCLHDHGTGPDLLWFSIYFYFVFFL